MMKIALVHDYLTQKGGAELVFQVLCKYFPDADIFTSLYNPDTSIDLGDRRVYTTVLQHLPQASKYFRILAPLYYPAFRALDLQDYDLIISSSSSFAKGVRKRKGAKHICFCYNVTRFLWDTQNYLKGYTDYKNFKFLIEPMFQLMRRLDLKYAQEPDVYLSISSIVAQRIEEIYHQKSIIIHPPIETDKFSFSTQKSDFYLVNSRLLSYKRIDIILETFRYLGWPLLIIGDGPERKYLESQASSNVQFLGYVNNTKRSELMAKAHCVIVAALEDYGLVPLEANFSGTPVISYGAGGVLDTQIPGKTGIFFKEQTPESLHAALLNFQTIDWDYAQIRQHVLNHYTEKIFLHRFEEILEQILRPEYS